MVWNQLLCSPLCVFRAGKACVQRLMQRHGIRARGKRKFVVTTDSKHDLRIAPKLLARSFTPATPNLVWTSDITCIDTEEGWLYGKRFATRREAMDEVMDWLTFYNHCRLQSTLGHVSPMTFEQRRNAGRRQDRKSA